MRSRQRIPSVVAAGWVARADLIARAHVTKRIRGSDIVRKDPRRGLRTASAFRVVLRNHWAAVLHVVERDRRDPGGEDAPIGLLLDPGPQVRALEAEHGILAKTVRERGAASVPSTTY